MQTIIAALQAATKQLYNTDIAVELTRPDEQFGDYATNIALQLAAKAGKSPRDIATHIADAVRPNLPTVRDITIAGPGFINFTLTDDAVLTQAMTALTAKSQQYKGQVVVTEYGDPNPFKILHAGHLYTAVVGDAIANLFQAAGATVHRVNYGGDVGLHVGRTLWAMLQELGGEQPDKLADIPKAERSAWMAACYVKGNNAYDDNPSAKAEIIELNKKVYQIHETKDHDSPLAQIYWTCRQWSYDHFTEFYARLGTHFEKFYAESDVAAIGLQTVRDHTAKGVYQHSDGAVVFAGEQFGLHTRVFINSHGLPTYEAKDVGLIIAKWRDYHFDKSLIITGSEQLQYMEVVLKSIEQFMPDLVTSSTHLTHGLIKMPGGVKMSSRRGNILRANDILDAASAANKKANNQENPDVVLAAVKYAFLKQRIGGDIIYDPAESVSLDGNSGPYLQYAYARAQSILSKAGDAHAATTVTDVTPDERSLLRKISEYPDVFHKALQESMPHPLCTYLYELTQVFNRFYEHNRVIGDPRQAERLRIVTAYSAVLQDGLALLGIPAPERL